MSNIDDFQQQIGEWANRTFPESTSATILAHLRDEVVELMDAEPAQRAAEAADCFLLLLHLAHRDGFSLFDAGVVKAAINAKRTWASVTNERGYFGHVKDEAGPQ
jgi:hypothetical protein